LKITNVRLRQLQGTLKYPGGMREERPARPLDIYPVFRKISAQDILGRGSPAVGEGLYHLTHTFLQIDTDEGVSGIVGPVIGDATAFYIAVQLKPLLIGQDPLATEYLWDVMYRNAVNGRMGENMIAISYIDVALWDIKGKWLNQPVCRLLGGPVQDKIPAYAATAGFSLEPEKAKERVRMLKEAGFCGTKWFFRRGISDGPQGEKENVALMRALREASGTDMKVMIDAWTNWGVPYTLRMADLLKEYDPAWIEEPVHYALHESYAKLRSTCPIAIAGGEHEYTRWGVKALMDLQALDIYQPEPLAVGGISEMIKICALATSYDVQLLPHVYYPAVSAHIAFTQNIMTTEMLEYHYILAENYQFFLKKPLKPIKGYFYPPETPGVGLDVDESRIESECEISF